MTTKRCKCGRKLIYLSFSFPNGEPVLDGYFCPKCHKEYFEAIDG